MKKSYLFTSTLIAAVALSVSAWATDYTFSKDSIPSADGITAGGDGSADTPYYITECGSSDRISISTDIFTDTGTTVYLGSDTQSFGAAGVNSFFSGSFTAACNIVIGSAGVYLTNGGSGQYYNFTGTISGDGSLTVGYYGTGNNEGSTVAQHYAFTGDLSGWTGDITITTSNSYDYLIFGGTITGANSNTGDVTGISATQAATNESVSGTGAISVDYGSVEYVYTAGANGNAGETLTVTNTSIEAHTVVFGGGVNYTVSSTITGWDAPSGTTSATSSTLTISNTGYTTTFTGAVSNFDNVTVSSGATLAVGEGGSLDLSGATVDLASTIQNSGTVKIDESTVFVLDNLTYTGDVTSDEGATYTLITNIDSGSVTISGTLGLDNVSSVHEITSATFDYTGGVLTVTVIESSDGLHGDGTINSPYYTSGSSRDGISSTSIFTSSGTVYLATEEHSFGNASEDIFWDGSFTAACDIVIGKAGVYLTNATSSQYYNFTGKISGEGSWTATGEKGSSPAIHYAFAGDLSGWSGDITISSNSTYDYLVFGGTIDGVSNNAVTGVTGVVAVTNTNVSGTGAISVDGTVQFNFVKPEEGATTGYDTVTIGNSSITAATLTFAGDVTYSVDLSKTTLSATTLNVGEEATLLISGSGTLTESSSSSSIAVSGTLEVAENATLTIDKHSHSSTSVANLVLGNGSTLVQNANTSGSGNNPSSKSDGLIIGTLTITSASSGQTGPSVTIRNSNWENYVNIGALIGENATLILTSDAASSLANVFELGTTTHEDEYVSESQFTGTISISDTNGSAGRAVSLVISEENIAAGAVIEFGTEASGQSLSLGVNAERVVIAGLSTSNSGTDIVYSGEVTANSNVGENGGSITSNSSTTNTLAINVADDASYSFHGVFLDKISLEKLGGGSQTITFESGSSFDGSIAVKAGTLALSGADISSSGITVDSSATLNISNHITLAATSDITSVTSTISGTLNIAEGGQLDLAGTVTINNAITNSGTITIADGTSITVGVTMQTGEYSGTNYDYYTLIDGSNGSGSVTLGDSVTFVINGTEITLSEIATLADGDTDWKGYISGGSLYIYAETSTTAATADTLYWAGTEDNNTWSTQSSDTPWSATDGGSSGYYFSEGASVTFGPNTDGELSTTVVLGEDITAGTVNINASGYTLTAGAGSTLTATSIVLDDEDSADTHTFTIGEGVTVTAGSLSETAGQLDLVVNGTLEISGAITVNTDDVVAESISGSGTLKAGSLSFSSATASGESSSLTLSVTSAEFDSISFANHGSDSNTLAYRTLIIGDTEAGHTTEVTTGSITVYGQSAISVTDGSKLTVTGDAAFGGGMSESISGAGSLIVNGTATFSTNSPISVSIADFQAGNAVFSASGGITISSASFVVDGAATFSGSGSVTISSASFKAGSAEFTNTNTITIASGANVEIGTILNNNSGAHSYLIEAGATLTTGSFNRQNGRLTVTVNGTLNVEKDIVEGADGYLSFGAEYSTHFGNSQTLTGTGTVNVYGFQYSSSGSNMDVSVAYLNIGEGGINKLDSGELHFAGTTIGLYNTDTLDLDADMTVDSAGVTFNTKDGEKLTLSGVITGNGLVAKTGDGDLTIAGTSTLSNGLTVSAGTLSVATEASLTLGGTVTLASAISNSGTITIADSTSFVLDNLTMETGGGEGNRDYYVLITGNSGTVTGSVTIDNFSLTDGDLSNWSVYTDGGYLVIYGEAQTTAGQQGENLTWAGTDVAFTWNTSSENAIWNDTDTGTSGYYFTDGNNVTFGADGAYTTVAVEGEVTAGSTTINGAYTFNIGEDASVTTGALTYGEGGSLTLTGSGTIVTQAATNANTGAIAFDASNFTGEMDFTEGFLDIANSTFNKEATVVVSAVTSTVDENTGVLTSTNVSLFVGNAESESTSEFVASLVLDGEGGVLIRTGTSDKNVTFSGSVTGTDATLQLNGGGNAVFTNTVNVATYINYQGSTTFSGATTLGELQIYKTEGNAGDVTFTGSAAQATVTALTIAQAGGSDAANLTVSNGASLTVTNLVVNHDVAIAIDKAALSITTSVTQASGTSTSVTISNGGTLALGSDVSLNVAAMEIVLGTDTYTNGTYAITGDNSSSLTLTDDAAIKITVDSALASLLETDGTYTFDIYSGLSLSTDVFDIDDILNYSENVSWNNGVLTVIVGSGAIPEPSMFGFFFGLGAIGLVATRRRRRAA